MVMGWVWLMGKNLWDGQVWGGLIVTWGPVGLGAIALIDRVATQMSQDAGWQDLILEPPKVLGVDRFGDNSITIRLWIQTQPLKQWEVGREFRRRLKYAFDAEGISIPFPQRSVWFENSPL